MGCSCGGDAGWRGSWEEAKEIGRPYLQLGFGLQWSAGLFPGTHWQLNPCPTAIGRPVGNFLFLAAGLLVTVGNCHAKQMFHTSISQTKVSYIESERDSESFMNPSACMRSGHRGPSTSCMSQETFLYFRARGFLGSSPAAL